MRPAPNRMAKRKADLGHTVAPVMTHPDSGSRSTARMCAATRRACLSAGWVCLVAPSLAGAEEAPGAQPVIVNLSVTDAQIELQFTPGFDAAQRGRAQAWVQRAADVVVRYFGRFPVPQLELLLQG